MAYPILTNPSDLFTWSNGETVLQNITDGTLGIGALFINGWSNASAQADKLAIAGSVTFMFLTNDAESNVQSGVDINQSVSSPTSAQTVTVSASSPIVLILVGGTIRTKMGLAVIPVGTSSKGGGAGGSFFGLVLNNTTHAYVGAAKVAANGGLSVLASENLELIMLTQAGASAQSTAVSGSIGLIDQTSDTLAQIDTGAIICSNPGTGSSCGSSTGSGGVTVNASSTEDVVAGAGDIVVGNGSGFGISALIIVINRTTRAVIGSADLTSPGDGGLNVVVNGPVSVSATNGGYIWAFAVAGTKVSKPTTPEAQPNGPYETPPPTTYWGKFTSGVSSVWGAIAGVFSSIGSALSGLVSATQYDPPLVETGIAVAGPPRSRSCSTPRRPTSTTSARSTRASRARSR